MYTILLVEDEAMELLALKYAVNSYYADTLSILEASDGNLALSLFQAYQPDIMIVDINIPGISGLELIQAVHELNRNTKILITTAYDKSNYVRRALDMGVLHYLLKPINIRELKAAVDHCLETLKESLLRENQMRSLQEGMESVRFYAKEYLVQDILTGNPPEDVLKTALGWPENGNLKIALLYWQPEQETDPESFFSLCSSHFDGLFSLLVSPVSTGKVLLLQARRPMEDSALLLFLNIHSPRLLAELGHGKMAGSGFCTSYQELYENWENLKRNVMVQGMILSLPSIPLSVLGPSRKRTLLRQKILQRIREHQVTPLILMLKKILSTPDCYWPGAALFLNALNHYDSSIDLCSLLAFFYLENALDPLADWLDNYVRGHALNPPNSPNAKSHIAYAVDLISKNFSQEISLTSMAEELGLSAPYFSNLFKQETGKNFVNYLNEVRIRHALSLMEEGETNMDKLAEQCGYYSKKYFFEAFKRITGQSITQYRHGDKK